MKIKLLIATLLLALIGAMSTAFDKGLNDPIYVLKNRLGFDDGEINKFEQGEAVTRRIETPNEAELLICGGVYIEVPVEFVINNSRDILQTNRTSAVAEIGLFSVPPEPGDLKGLTIEESDLDAIKKSKVRNSDIKLSTTYIKKFHELNKRSATYADEVGEIFRSMILSYMDQYQNTGIEALPSYSDQKYTLDLRKEYSDILLSSALLRDYDPNILKYLEEYPDFKMEGVEDYFFWIKQDFDNLRPIISLNHTCLFLPDSTRPAILTKTQLYASHYYEGSLEASIFFPRENNPEHRGCYLLYIKRARFDTLRRGSFLGIKTSKLRSGVENEVENLLRKTKRKVESLYNQSKQEQ